MSFNPEHWPALPRDCDTGEALEVSMVFPEVGHAVATVWQLSLFSRPFCIDAITYRMEVGFDFDE
jgi:hypothetical protein